MDTYTTRVSDTQLINDHFLWLKLELVKPTQFLFEAGQYILIDIPGKERNIRQYSIASPPSISHQIDLLINLKPDGVGSQYLAELVPGDAVEIRGPAGRFTISSEDINEEHELIFVATSSGMSPIRSMILDLLHNKQSKQTMQLFWGMRFATDLIWEEDLRMIDEAFENFSYHIVLSQPPELWPFSDKHVTDKVAKLETNNAQRFFLCGGESMIVDVRHILQEKAVKPEHVHWERFY